MADRDLQDILSSGEITDEVIIGNNITADAGSSYSEIRTKRKSPDGTSHEARGLISTFVDDDGTGFTRLALAIDNTTVGELRVSEDGNASIGVAAPTADNHLTRKDYVDSAIAKVADDVATINGETFDLFEYSGSLGRSLSRTECNDIFTQFLGHLPNENVKLTVIDDDNKVFTITYLASRDKYFYTKLTMR